MRRAARQLVAIMTVAVLTSSLAPEPALAGGPAWWQRAARAANQWRSESCREAKAWVRGRVVRDADLERYGLTCDPHWERSAFDKPLVVLLHGFNSTADRHSALLRPLRAGGYPCAAFAFPNDHDLVESAALLASELNKLAGTHADRRIAILTHSMGGLVALECVENPQLDPGNVDRLILIAPPTRGTYVAHLAVCADVWEHGLFRRRGGCWTRLKDSIVDGLAEAAEDMRPGSAFLARLNARPRNPRVQYSMLLGTGGKLRHEEVVAARLLLRRTVGKMPGFRSATRKLDRWLGEMDEVIGGRGDGIVALKRARLAGVDDVVTLPFGHVGVAGEPTTGVIRQVHQEVLARLNGSSHQSRSSQPKTRNVTDRTLTRSSEP